MYINALALAASITVTAEATYAPQTFPDRTVDFGIFRDPVTALTPNIPESSAIYVPLTELTENLDTTERGATAELLRIDFFGHIESLGLVGDVETMTLTHDDGLLIETDRTLTRRDLSSGEDTWKIALPVVTGEITGVALSQDGDLYVKDEAKGQLLKFDGQTGLQVATIHPDASVGTYWGVAQVLHDGQILIFGSDRYTMVDDTGAVLWHAGKVYPQKSYGDARLVGANVLLTEYISSSNPDPNLKRRTASTLVDAAGHEIWTRTDFAEYLAQSDTAIFFQQHDEAQNASILALDRATGNVLWTKPLGETRDVYLSAVTDQSRVIVGTLGTVLVLNAADGSTIASQTWPDRTMTKVLSSDGKTIVVTSEASAAPNPTYVDHLTVQ